MKLTKARKLTFLAELARHGILARAARAASPGARTGALTTFVEERARDPHFSRGWDEAIEAANAAIEHELYRRAQVGVEEPIYGGKYREKVVGTVRRYSDPLLMFVAKAKLPAYRDVTRVEGSVTHKLDAGLLGEAVADVAARLAASMARPAIAAPRPLIDATVCTPTPLPTPVRAGTHE